MYEELIKEIKRKKELSNISSSIVLDVLKDYLKKNRFDESFIDSLSLYEKKTLIKEMRAILRLNYGRFQISQKSKEDSSNVKDLIKLHSSTNERLTFYPNLIKRINLLRPNSILDLACGLNPLVLASKEISYFACDIDEKEIGIINRFFKENQITGKAYICDLKKSDIKFPKVDLVLIFKFLDIIEKKGHKTALNIIKKLEAKHILVSFATKTLSGKDMQIKRRFWFERLLFSLNLDFEVFESENEIFYQIINLRK